MRGQINRGLVIVGATALIAMGLLGLAIGVLLAPSAHSITATVREAPGTAPALAAGLCCLLAGLGLRLAEN